MTTATRSRIGGIDMARALAIVGMVMVHIGPSDAGRPGLDAQAYRLSHGRASILFVLLAGIGVSMLTGDRSAPRVRSASERLLWRAVVLLPAGLALQETGVGVAVILQYYAAYFLVAVVLLRLGDRAVLAVVLATATLGPALFVATERTVPAWFDPDPARWYDVVGVLRDVLLTGHYPVVVWAAPLALGVWIGRRDLRDRRVALWLLAAGAAAVVVGFTVSNMLITRFGLAVDPTDWHQLYMDEPHDNMPLWLVTSTGAAVAVTGGCLVLAARWPRGTWPLVAFGQLAFTAYVLHLLVLRWLPQWLARDTVVAAWLSTARFTVLGLVLATAYRAVAQRGPFELLLRPPRFAHGTRAAALPVAIAAHTPTTAADTPTATDDLTGVGTDDGTP